MITRQARFNSVVNHYDSALKLKLTEQEKNDLIDYFIVERPDGVKIAAFFISAIVIVSLVSRVWRTTELRTGEITLDAAAERFIDQAARGKALRIIANQPRHCHDAEYSKREREQREDNGIPPEDRVLFLEIYVPDASEFSAELHVRGVEVGSHQVLRAESAAVANGIAALLLYLRDRTGQVPHAYFSWTEGNPVLYMIRYVLSGYGDVAPITREVLRQAEHNPARRPRIHAL